MTPTLSIIIPAYNAEAILGQALDSILSQPFPSEIIVVDDGSADGTVDLARSYQDRGVNVLVPGHGGAGAARNAGIRAATGDCVIFLDADDLIIPEAFGEAFQAALVHMVEDQVDIVYGVKTKYTMDLSQQLEIVFPQPIAEIEHFIPYTEFWTCVYRRSFLLEKGVFFFEYAEQDVETAFRYRAFSRAEKAESREDLAFYLQRDNLSSNTHTWKLPVLYSVKGRIYAELFRESLGLSQVGKGDLLFLRNVAVDMTSSFVGVRDDIADEDERASRCAFVDKTLDLLVPDSLSQKRLGMMDGFKMHRSVSGLRKRISIR